MKQQLLFLCLLVSFFGTAQDYKFLGTYDDQGVPDYLVGRDNISAATMQMISDALPEGYPVPDYNPHYITAGYDTDLILDKDAAVWVTFVKEGAGYKNVLGFYTYDINAPKQPKPEPKDITIIFPNVSAAGSGGGLYAGDKVKIGDFKAGTGIGWVLLANGWRGYVTGGHWQVFSNPDYNPEADPELRKHNVLLADPENERVILGFEDIRRDYASCDQDFNDALFYVTANPYDAIRTANFVDIKSATDVSSANLGGLESNGNLASLIAKRNFSRIKENNFKDHKRTQSKYKAQGPFMKNSQVNLESLLPETGMFGSEQSYESSPEDLLAITNAKEIFSVDYYQGDMRVAAALATLTDNGIYDHSKVICDRLNSSSLEDIRTIQLAGHEIIMIKTLRASGQLEYALNFSVQLNGSGGNKLYSFWNIGDYPKGNYANFQIWGGSMGQVSTLAKHVIDTFKATNGLSFNTEESEIPSVFVKKGVYKNGQLHLRIKNNSGATAVNFQGNIRATEVASETDFNKNISLAAEYEEEVIVDAGSLFDVGLEIQGNNSPKADALYLADGPWGIDYAEAETKINSFSITEVKLDNFSNNSYQIERNVNIDGEIYGTLNVFRNILAGDQQFYTDNFEALEFTSKSNLPIEVILVTDGLTDWNKRYRYAIETNADGKIYNLRLSDFSNDSESFKGEPLKGIVFSVQGNYSAFQQFNVNIENVQFTNFREIPSQENPIAVVDTPVKKAYNYPNPFRNNTSLVLPKSGKNVKVMIFDMGGKMVHNKVYELENGKIEVPIQLKSVPPGIYNSIIIVDNKDKSQIGLVVN
ncbi:DUF4114 domain-containing protein [Zunongwangia sp. SCSIO 43204]|uniref:DUF4114 domain-containing protein n=1 Tax=Zunongwangia sp. SCSIO 43204 TaxID=2779359 RepID=UPI001CA9FCA2|nr:DUF4114 domain-containing protein [Zunongwangia sp. SCSIO 43204]UAB86107.1 DUF4114 domain-containing protein [Zunongwangia sp. SCSIO 43204]